MAFRFHDISRLVAEDPGSAADRLAALFEQASGNATLVAGNLGVDYRTLMRWLARLEKAGHAVKRAHQRGRPPAASSTR